MLFDHINLLQIYWKNDDMSFARVGRSSSASGEEQTMNCSVRGYRLQIHLPMIDIYQRIVIISNNI